MGNSRYGRGVKAEQVVQQMSLASRERVTGERQRGAGGEGLEVCEQGRMGRSHCRRRLPKVIEQLSHQGKQPTHTFKEKNMRTRNNRVKSPGLNCKAKTTERGSRDICSLQTTQETTL